MKLYRVAQVGIGCRNGHVQYCVDIHLLGRYKIDCWEAVGGGSVEVEQLQNVWITQSAIINSNFVKLSAEESD